VIGLLLLLPPTRSVLRGVVQRRLGQRAFEAAGEFGARRTRQRPADYDVDGTASEYDAEVPRREDDPRRRRLER
jgi:UPF0716 family protein affecting phage T7 exclusion